jgi:hypothetical protein
MRRRLCAVSSRRHSLFCRMTEPSPKPADQQSARPALTTTEKRVADLRSAIGDLAMEVDAHKAKIAGCVGGGVFLFMLAALAAYDLLKGNSGLWLAVGVTKDLLGWVASGLGLLALAAFAYALRLEKGRDTRRENRMQELELELEQLLNHKISQEHE